VPQGLKLDMLGKNPRVCIEIDQVDDLANWRSIVAPARIEELEEDKEAERALELGMARLMALTPRKTSALSEILASTRHAPSVRWSRVRSKQHVA
jgi:uncharacterized protein